MIQQEEQARASCEEKVRVAREADLSHRRLEETLAEVVGQREEKERVVHETEKELSSLTTSLSAARNLHKFKNKAREKVNGWGG